MCVSSKQLAAGLVMAVVAGAPAFGGEGGCTPSWSGAIGTPGIDDSYIANFVAYDDGSGAGARLYATGAFPSAGGGTPDTSEIAVWTGATWAAVGGGLHGGFSNVMEVFQGDLYVGGYFDSAGPIASPAPGSAKLARWNGASWAGVNAQLEAFTNSVWALKVHDDGRGPALFVGGNYQNIGGTPYSYISRFDGTSFSEVGGTIAGPVALIILDIEVFNGELYVGGRFTSIDGVPATHIAKWNGSTWSAVGANNGITGTQVLCLHVFDDGSGGGEALYVGGTFTAAGGVPATRVAKWNGVTWSAMGAGLSGNVNALVDYDDGSGNGPSLYAVGSFLNSGATPVGRLARWDGTNWVATGPGLNANGFAATIFDDGSGVGPAMYIGGSFTSVNGVAANRAAAYIGCPLPGMPGDITGDGMVNVNDLLEVISGWGVCPLPPPPCAADISPAPGGDGQVNVNDLLEVINNWG